LRLECLRLQKLTILLIEDNQTIAQQLCEFLEKGGWGVDWADNGSRGIQLALAQQFDVIILDLNLPDIDGLEVCKAIKQQSSRYLPILMLTARDSYSDKAAGFGLGADDYVTKPFELAEISLRCEALARRNLLHQNKQIIIGDLLIDQGKYNASRAGTRLKLTNVGFKILLSLARAFPQAVSRSQLRHSVWRDDQPDSDALRSHIYSLRNALDKPFEFAMLKTITNVGYKLVLTNED
jgi:DNA-binding response OmpR family regulator